MSAAQGLWDSDLDAPARSERFIHALFIARGRRARVRHALETHREMHQSR